MRTLLMKKIILFLSITAVSAAYYSENSVRNADFVEATIFGDYPLLESEIKSGFNPNAPYGQQGEPTALMLAAERGDLKMAEFLINGKANINMKDSSGNTPLMYAVKKGNMDMVRLILKNRADINLDNNIGKTALETAAGKGNTEIVKLLLENNARHGIELALGTASKYGFHDIVGIMLSHSAPVTLKDREGYTALYHAANIGSIESAEVLIKHKSDVNMTQKDNDTPLTASVKNGDLKMTKFLIAAGGKPDIKNYDGRFPLIEAVRTNMPEMVALFSGPGINFNEKDYQLNTPLLHLSLLDEKPQTGIADFIIKKGGDINFKNREGKTALINAAAKGHTDLAKFLIEKGADINILDRNRKDAAYWASFSGSADILGLLLTRGAKDPKVKPGKIPVEANRAYSKMERFFNALNIGNLNIIKYEIEKGIDVNSIDRDGNTPLIIASNSKLPQKIAIKIIKHLMKRDADPNIRNKNGICPLDLASENESHEIIKYLIENDADKKGLKLFIYSFKNKDSDLINYLLENKKIDLSEALFAIDDYRIAKLLIKAGADVNSKDKSGRTPIMIRSELHGRWSYYKTALILEEYIKAGADINANDGKGNTALSIAKGSMNKKLIDFLVKNGAK